MSYEKIALEIPLLSSALAAVAPAAADPTTLLAAGQVVQLETGDRAWVACVGADNPETVALEFACVAIAVDADGAVCTWPSSQPIASAFMHGAAPEIVVSLGRDAIRKNLMQVALGETPDDPEAFAAMNTAERSIRTAISAAAQIAAPLTDVL